MSAVLDDLASPESRPVTVPDSGSSVDTLLASALQRNMSFTEDRKRQHTPGTANRPRQLRKAADLDSDDLKENHDPVAHSTKKKVPEAGLAASAQMSKMQNANCNK
ncbi:hypothetical protein ABBQ32_005191 [Trebouxia sp. C0010 RCD-2024]